MKITHLFSAGVLLCSISIANPGDSEERRIQRRLNLIETLLRTSDVSSLSTEQRSNRKRNLDVLHKYWTAGVFPKNTNHRHFRVPYFIDEYGTFCAVGYLMKESGHEALARQISISNNHVYFDQAEDPEIEKWIETSGLTREELTLIQPSYGPQPVLTAVGKLIQAGDKERLQKDYFENGVPRKDLLAMAVAMRNIELVEWLLENKADASAVVSYDLYEKGPVGLNPPMPYRLNPDGRPASPMELALPAEDYYVSIPIAELLASHGAKPSKTAEQVYRTYTNKEAFKFLLKFDVPVDGVGTMDQFSIYALQIKDGTLLDLAICNDEDDFVKILKERNVRSNSAALKKCQEYFKDWRVYRRADKALQAADMGALRAELKGEYPMGRLAMGQQSLLLRTAIMNSNFEAVEILLSKHVKPRFEDENICRNQPKCRAVMTRYIPDKIPTESKPRYRHRPKKS